MKNIILKIVIFLFFLCLLVFPSEALSGATNGLLLWFNTVLPSLLPFLILSNLMVVSGIASILCRFLSPLFSKVFRISALGCYPILIGLLSGYPVGAKTCADFVRNKKISLQEGQFLAACCNNASILFVTSYILLSQLNETSLSLPFLCIIFLSSFSSAALYRFFFQKEKLSLNRESKSVSLNSEIPQKSSTYITSRLSFSQIDSAILEGFEIITKIGGYMILFSILAQIVSSFSIPDMIKLPFIGLLEITTGIHSIALSSYKKITKTVLITSITAFGGLSSIAQTKSVMEDSGLSIITYIKTRCMNALIAGFLMYLYLNLR